MYRCQQFKNNKSEETELRVKKPQYADTYNNEKG